MARDGAVRSPVGLWWKEGVAEVWQEDGSSREQGKVK
jgi:hypothetical protein